MVLHRGMQVIYTSPPKTKASKKEISEEGTSFHRCMFYPSLKRFELS